MSGMTTQYQRLAELEPAGDAVGLVLGLAQQRLDPLPGRWGDPQTGVVVRDPRDRGGVDVGAGAQFL